MEEQEKNCCRCGEKVANNTKKILVEVFNDFYPDFNALLPYRDYVCPVCREREKEHFKRVQYMLNHQEDYINVF